jgi:hypothetical protein
MRNSERRLISDKEHQMLKISFKFQVAVILITVALVVWFVIRFLNKTEEQAQFAQTKALQAADFGFQEITQKAISPETGAFMIDLLTDTSGLTGDGGEFSVSVVKDTISADSIVIKIDSRGMFANEERLQSQRKLLVSPDSINWVIAD